VVIWAVAPLQDGDERRVCDGHGHGDGDGDVSARGAAADNGPPREGKKPKNRGLWVTPDRRVDFALPFPRTCCWRAGLPALLFLPVKKRGFFGVLNRESKIE